MKKLLVAVLAALFVLSIGMVALADDKSPAAAEPAKETAVKEEKAAAPAAQPAKDAAAASTEKTQEKAPEAPVAEKK